MFSEQMTRSIFDTFRLIDGHLQDSQRPSASMVRDFIRFFDSPLIHTLLNWVTEDEKEFKRELYRRWGFYLQSINAIEPFKAGEIICGPDGVKVRINAINADDYGPVIIVLTVVETTDSWSREFPVGLSFSVTRVHTREEVGYDTWSALDEKLPAFILSLGVDGRKTFEHRR